MLIFIGLLEITILALVAAGLGGALWMQIFAGFILALLLLRVAFALGQKWDESSKRIKSVRGGK